MDRHGRVKIEQKLSVLGEREQAKFEVSISSYAARFMWSAQKQGRGGEELKLPHSGLTFYLLSNNAALSMWQRGCDVQTGLVRVSITRCVCGQKIVRIHRPDLTCQHFPCLVVSYFERTVTWINCHCFQPFTVSSPSHVFHSVSFSSPLLFCVSSFFALLLWTDSLSRVGASVSNFLPFPIPRNNTSKTKQIKPEKWSTTIFYLFFLFLLLLTTVFFLYILHVHMILRSSRYTNSRTSFSRLSKPKTDHVPAVTVKMNQGNNWTSGLQSELICHNS